MWFSGVAHTHHRSYLPPCNIQLGTLSWDQLDQKLQFLSSPWANFSRGIIPPTQDMNFKKAVHEVEY